MHPALNGLVPLLKRSLKNLVMELHETSGRYERDPKSNQQQRPE